MKINRPTFFSEEKSQKNRKIRFCHKRVKENHKSQKIKNKTEKYCHPTNLYSFYNRNIKNLRKKLKWWNFLTEPGDARELKKRPFDSKSKLHRSEVADFLRKKSLLAVTFVSTILLKNTTICDYMIIGLIKRNLFKFFLPNDYTIIVCRELLFDYINHALASFLNIQKIRNKKHKKWLKCYFYFSLCFLRIASTKIA